MLSSVSRIELLTLQIRFINDVFESKWVSEERTNTQINCPNNRADKG